MSQQEEQPKTQVNNELTERVNKAHIASNFILLNGGTDNIIMISAEKDESLVDILVTYDALEQVLNDLKPDIKKIDSGNEL